MLTNDVVSFEQPGPGVYTSIKSTKKIKFILVMAYTFFYICRGSEYVHRQTSDGLES